MTSKVVTLARKVIADHEAGSTLWTAETVAEARKLVELEEKLLAEKLKEEMMAEEGGEDGG